MSRTPARRGHINWRPFAPDAPFPPPPPRPPPRPFARDFTTSSRDTKQRARVRRTGRTPLLRPAWFIREPRVEWEGSVRKRFCPFPHPLHLPSSSRAETENRRPKFSHSPPFYRVRGSKSAKGATRARPAISAPSGQRYASGKRTRGGSVRSTDSSAWLFSCPLFHSFEFIERGASSVCANHICPLSFPSVSLDEIDERFGGFTIFREMERGNRLERYIYSFSFYFRRMDRWLVDFKKWWFIFSAFLFIFSSKQRRRKCKENVYFFHFDLRGRLLVFYCLYCSISWILWIYSPFYFIFPYISFEGCVDFERRRINLILKENACDDLWIADFEKLEDTRRIFIWVILIRQGQSRNLVKVK